MTEILHYKYPSLENYRKIYYDKYIKLFKKE